MNQRGTVVGRSALTSRLLELLWGLCSFIPLPLYPSPGLILAFEPGNCERGICFMGRNLNGVAAILRRSCALPFLPCAAFPA